MGALLCKIQVNILPTEEFVEKLQQEYVLSIIFIHAIERESLLMKKYQEYVKGEEKNAGMKEMLKQFEKETGQHLTILRDKMAKLNIQG